RSTLFPYTMLFRSRDDRGVSHRRRSHHRTTSGRKPHRKRTSGVGADRRGRQRLRDGLTGNMREGRSGRTRGRWGADVAGHRTHDRGHGGMSDELLAVADQLIDEAGPGEQVEVVLGRSRSTEVRAYDGEVEQFASATSAGVGIRVIADQRQGFASAGTLDAEVINETLAEARDNARFATPDDWLGLAEPDGVPVPDLDLWREGIDEVSPEDKIELALELERAARSGDARIAGVESADYADGVYETVIASTTGIRVASRDAACHLSVACVAEDADDTQTGFGFSVGRLPGELDVEV